MRKPNTSQCDRARGAQRMSAYETSVVSAECPSPRTPKAYSANTIPPAAP